MSLSFPQKIKRWLFLVGLFFSLYLGAVTCVLAAPRFIYAANFFDGSISIYRVDAETGMLFHQSHVPTLKGPSSLILHPSGRFLYVVSQTVDQIAIYQVDARSGMLVEIPGSPVSSRVRSVFRLGVSPDGRYLYAPGRFSRDLAVFDIDQQTGLLTPHMLENLPTHGERARFMEVSSDGRLVYVSNTFSDTVAAYRIDPVSGDITPVAGMPFKTGDAPQDAIIHPNGNYLYVNNWIDGNISSYAIKEDSGALEPLPGPLTVTGQFPFSGMFHPSGKYLYVANWASSDISSFAVDGESGALTPLREKRISSVGDSPVTITLDASGRHAYVPTYADSAMTIFSVDATSGRLKNPRRLMTRPGVRDLAMLEGDESVRITPKYLLASDAAKATINSYVLDEKGGVPSLLSQFELGTPVEAIALSPNGKWLYVANNKVRRIGTLVVSARGRLAPLKDGEISLPGEPKHLRVNAQGNHLYVVTQNPHQFVTFSIDDKTGRLKLLEQETLVLPDESLPSLVVGTPEERLNYVLDTARGKAFGYRYLSADGPLNYELAQFDSPFEVLAKATDLAVSANGLWALVVSADGKLASYALPGIWNPLKLHRQGELSPGGDLVDIAIHPKSRWVYLLDAQGQRIVPYHLDANSGGLQAAGSPMPLKAKPRELVLDASGKTAYLRYSDRAGMTRFLIDPETGRLTQPLELLPELLPSSVVISYHIQ